MNQKYKSYFTTIAETSDYLDTHATTLSRKQTIELLREFLQKKQSTLRPEVYQNLTELISSTSQKKPYNLLDSNEPGFILTRMKTSYDSKLGFEYLFFNSLPDTFGIKQRYPSTATPVDLVSISPRLNRSRIMALFPENWHQNFRLKIDVMPVYYFMDRFLERHLQITRSVIQNFCQPDTFQDILDASPQEVVDCATIWVSLHEYYHTHCLLPLPRSIDFKASKEAGALEELRVDLCSISELSTSDFFPKQIAERASQYILSERLLHYASMSNPNQDYDAIASQMLFNYLSTNKILKLSDGRLHISDEVWSAITTFRDELNRVEKTAVGMAPKDATDFFAQTTRKLGGYNTQLKRYDWLSPYPQYCNFLNQKKLQAA